MKKWMIVLYAVIMAVSITGIVIVNNLEVENPYEGVPNPIATITLTDGSVMTAELYLQYAPNTVNNFVELANSGFYDGLIFHRIVNNVFVQTGDPTGLGHGGADYTIFGEFTENGFENPISHERGVLSMSLVEGDNNSASSQFFIMHGYYSGYDGKHAAFGKLIGEESYAVLDMLGTTPTDSDRRPLKMRQIETIRVETFGHTFEVIKNENP